MIRILHVEKVDMLVRWLPTDLWGSYVRGKLLQVLWVYHEKSFIDRKLLDHLLIPIIPMLYRPVLLVILIIRQVSKPLS